MASKSEMESEHRKDTYQWSHRVVRTLHEYRKERSEEVLEYLRDLVREKVDLGYSYDDIDPAGVTGLTDDDIDILRKLEEQDTQEGKKVELSEQAKNWAQRLTDVLKEYHNSVFDEDVVARASSFVKVRKLVREKVDKGYSFDYIEQSEESGMTAEDREWLDVLAEKMEAEQER